MRLMPFFSKCFSFRIVSGNVDSGLSCCIAIAWLIKACQVFSSTLLKDFFKGVEDGLSDVPPYADFSYSPSYDIYSNETIEFFDASSEGLFGSDIVKWKWDFGDGSINTQQHPTHVYKNGGIYQVNLTVTNKKGKTDFHLEDITIGFSCELEWGKNYTMGSLLVYPESYSFSESSTEGAKYLNINVTVKNIGQTEISLWTDSYLYYRGEKKRDGIFVMETIYPEVNETDTASFEVPTSLQPSECKFSIEEYFEPFHYKITWILE